MCPAQRKVDPGRLAQAYACRTLLVDIRQQGAMLDMDLDALNAAIDALNSIDGRSSNRTIRDAFYNAQQQMLYALRLKTPR